MRTIHYVLDIVIYNFGKCNMIKFVFHVHYIVYNFSYIKIRHLP